MVEDYSSGSHVPIRLASTNVLSGETRTNGASIEANVNNITTIVEYSCKRYVSSLLGSAGNINFSKWSKKSQMNENQNFY